MLLKENLNNDSTASGDFLDANFLSTEVKNNCWNCNPQSVEFWQITPHFQQYVYQLKTPPTMGSWSNHDSSSNNYLKSYRSWMFVSKKTPKSVTIYRIGTKPFLFQLFRTNLPNPLARCWFPCPEPLQGLKQVDQVGWGRENLHKLTHTAMTED